VDENSIIKKQCDQLVTITESELKLWDIKSNEMKTLDTQSTIIKSTKKFVCLEIIRGILVVLEPEIKKLFIYQTQWANKSYEIVLIDIKELEVLREIKGLAIAVNEYKKDTIGIKVLMIESNELKVFSLWIKPQRINISAIKEQFKPEPIVVESKEEVKRIQQTASKIKKDNNSSLKALYKPSYKLKRKKPEPEKIQSLICPNLSLTKEALYKSIQHCEAQEAKLDSLVFLLLI